MPALAERERWGPLQLLQLFVLVAAVPLQLWLSSGSNESVRQYEIDRVLSKMSTLRSVYLNMTVWQTWCADVWNKLSGVDDMAVHPPQPQVEANDDVIKNGYFSSSQEPRAPRPPSIQYRIGQVMRHRTNRYRCVIIGWDPVARAPAKWLDQMHPADKPHWRELPNYACLVDTRDRLTPQISYVVEENVEIISSTRIMHPLVNHYFENFDGAQYIPRPWLRKVYPFD